MPCTATQLEVGSPLAKMSSGLKLRYGMSADLTEDEHTKWAQSLWFRLDRDRSGEITSEELNCDEFQEILRLALTPKAAGHDGSRASYGRSEQNVKALLEFCIRKADMNGDGTLQFAEFRALLRSLRSDTLEHASEMIFAMFDLDGDQTIDREEFIEVFRYYNARNPREDELTEEWARLDPFGKGHATKTEFLRWMQTSKNPVFRQHAPPLSAPSSPQVGSPTSVRSPSSPAMKKTKKPEDQRPAPGMLPHMYHESSRDVSRMPWNQRFRGTDTVLLNKELPAGQRKYFSRPQSMPELKRFYNTYAGFEDQNQRLRMPRPRRKLVVCSTEIRPEQDISPGRHVPDGWMRDKRSKVVLWNNAWVPTHAELAQQKRIDTGINYLRCPRASDIPAFLWKGRDADD